MEPLLLLLVLCMLFSPFSSSPFSSSPSSSSSSPSPSSPSPSSPSPSSPSSSTVHLRRQPLPPHPAARPLPGTTGLVQPVGGQTRPPPIIGPARRLEAKSQACPECPCCECEAPVAAPEQRSILVVSPRGAQGRLKAPRAWANAPAWNSKPNFFPLATNLQPGLRDQHASCPTPYKLPHLPSASYLLDLRLLLFNPPYRSRPPSASASASHEWYVLAHVSPIRPAPW